MHKWLYGSLAALSLVTCLATGALFFLGYIEPETYRKGLAAASLAWFVFAAAWSGKAARSQKHHGGRNSSES